MQQTQSARGRSFRVGRWQVQPDLNRVSSDGHTVQLEPKVMDLLIVLTDRAGEVLSRQEIIDAVWQQEFVGDSTLTSAIAVLRRTLQDDSRDPRYIETIAKRGYRLVARVAEAEALAEVTPFPGLVMPRERSPYPGLAPFTESEAKNFFGREAEAAALWQKIDRQRMLAVIGPSGVGKSSFVRAGVIPSAPEGWGTLAFSPGASPFNSLARALAPEFSGDTEAVQQLLACHDAEAALAMVSRWRERWHNILLVVDQFEELFTLNEQEDQAKFAGFLWTLVSSSDAHVVLVMRDDFLYDCHAHPGLVSVFKDLTVLGPLHAEGLHRAAVEPASHLGYHFEDEELTGEMVDEVVGERGATPMLAFALSRLWELRDREHRRITRDAYERIGGVTGALAHHAEEVLVTIGDDRQPIVREIFRNLVTAQGTRATRQVNDLLSVFAPGQQAIATEVLHELVNGRLLTAFEERTEDDGQTSHRVEIAHESLLSAWPRLVRWQTQDADAALLRDQVRQAARLWHDQGRSDDLLWTGTAYRELQLWQERYPGTLSAVERAFVQGSVGLAGRRKRRRRVAAAAGFAAVLVLSAVMTGLWWRGALEARRADAKHLFLKGKVDLDFYPNGTFTDAVASLEMHDDPEVRRLALEAMWRIPMPAQVLWTDSLPVGLDFSPDGSFLAIGYVDGTAHIWSAAGGEPAVFEAHPAPIMVRFSPDSRSLACMGVFDSSFRFFSVPEGEPLGDAEPGDWPPGRDMGDALGYGNMRRLVRIAPRAGGESLPWTVDCSGFQRLARLGGDLAALDPAGERMVLARGGRLLVQDDAEAEPRDIADHHLGFEQMALHPGGDMVATIDTNGEVQLWSLTKPMPEPVRVFKGDRQSKCWDLTFDPNGSLLAATQESGKLWIWGMDDPPDADPLRIIGGWAPGYDFDFDPSGRWLARAGSSGAAVLPMDRRRFGYVLRGHSGPVEQVRFAPDGSSLVSTAVDGDVRLWPMRSSTGERGRVLCRIPQPAADLGQLAVAGDGSFVATTTGHGAIMIAPVEGGAVRELAGFFGRVLSVAVSHDGRLMAAGSGYPIPADAVIRVWDLVDGGITTLDAADGLPVAKLAFTRDDQLLAVAAGHLCRWNLATRERELLLEDVVDFGSSRNGEAVVVLHTNGSASYVDLTNATTVPLTNHGDTLRAVAIAPDGRTVVTGDDNRMVRVGPADGSEPHLLYGHEAMVKTVAVSPDGRWIASGSRDCTVRLWPMPSGRPLHTLPYEELMEKLHALRSYRRVPSKDTMRGFVDEPIPFRGWQSFPEW